MDRQTEIQLTAQPLSKHSKIYVAGHSGMVGSSLLRRLVLEGFQNIIFEKSSTLDLKIRSKVFDYFLSERPEVVFLAAAKVGGIQANSRYPADFLSENLQIQINVLDAAHAAEVPRLLFLGSSCIYPKLAPQPISESALMTGPLEPTNDGYAIAKIAGIYHVSAMRRQFGHHWISAMPTNLYGPGDNYDVGKSHVLPAMIRRYEEARVQNKKLVKNWGSGHARREFMHVDDLAEACLFLLKNYDGDSHINVGTGHDISIFQLSQLIANSVGYEGETTWDTSKPDGTPQKLLDVSKLNLLGWESKIPLVEGLETAIDDFRIRYPG